MLGAQLYHRHELLLVDIDLNVFLVGFIVIVVCIEARILVRTLPIVNIGE